MAQEASNYPDGVYEAIEPDVAAALDRHIERTGKARDTISLNPYELVPLEDYDDLRQEYEEHLARWVERGIDIGPVIKATLLVDTATEDNLPWYTAQISRGFEEWDEWNRRWTTEEKPHGMTMEREMEARGLVDMAKEWQPIREGNLGAGIHVNVKSPADGASYVAVQELLTRKAHMNSARIMDESGAANLRTVGGDEGRHYNFYLSALAAMGRDFPDYTLMSMRRQHEGDAFQMPGSQGIPGYEGMARTISMSGVFDAVTVLEAQKQTIEEAKLLDAEPVSDEGKEAKDWATSIVDTESKVWQRKRKLMDIMRERAARTIEGDEMRPFILGQTVELKGTTYEAKAA